MPEAMTKNKDEGQGGQHSGRREDDRVAPDLHLQVGELNGRMSAVERDQQNLNRHLTRIEDQLHHMSKRMAWFAGGIAVAVPIFNFVLWYFAIAGVGPF